MTLAWPHLSFTNESPWKHHEKSHWISWNPIHSPLNHHEMPLNPIQLEEKNRKITRKSPFLLGTASIFLHPMTISLASTRPSHQRTPATPRRPSPARAPLSDPSSHQRPDGCGAIEWWLNGCDPNWLVVWTPLKNISQLGWFFPIYGKIKNVPNHQPANVLQIFSKGTLLRLLITKSFPMVDGRCIYY